MQKTLKSLKKILISNNLTLSAGESCTGGQISAYLTDIDGASNFIEQCFVTYAPGAKVKFLNVNPKTIEKYTVVSKEVAREMAKGLLEYADCAISTTGYAASAEDDAPGLARTVFIGLGLKKGNKKIIKTLKFHSAFKTRKSIKKDFAKYALIELLTFLTNEI